MSEWKVLVGRISLFPSQQSATTSALDVFKTIWGADPDNFRKQANPLLPTIARGMQNGMVANCTTIPGRIDVELTPADSADSSFTLIEDTRQLRKELDRIIHAIAQGLVSGPVSRVALVMHLVTVCPNVADANTTVTNIMPEKYRVRIKDEGDFIFQVNQTSASREAGGITMNSLKKWSVERFQLLSIRVPMAGAAVASESGAPTTHLTREFIGASLMLEINNVPVTDLLSTEKQGSLLLECLAEIVQAQQQAGLSIEGFEK